MDLAVREGEKGLHVAPPNPWVGAAFVARGGPKVTVTDSEMNYRTTNGSGQKNTTANGSGQKNTNAINTNSNTDDTITNAVANSHTSNPTSTPTSISPSIESIPTFLLTTGYHKGPGTFHAEACGSLRLDLKLHCLFSHVLFAAMLSGWLEIVDRLREDEIERKGEKGASFYGMNLNQNPTAEAAVIGGSHKFNHNVESDNDINLLSRVDTFPYPLKLGSPEVTVAAKKKGNPHSKSRSGFDGLSDRSYFYDMIEYGHKVVDTSSDWDLLTELFNEQDVLEVCFLGPLKYLMEPFLEGRGYSNGSDRFSGDEASENSDDNAGEEKRHELEVTAQKRKQRERELLELAGLACEKSSNGGHTNGGDHSINDDDVLPQTPLGTATLARDLLFVYVFSRRVFFCKPRPDDDDIPKSHSAE
jgi:hypothetical protein